MGARLLVAGERDRIQTGSAMRKRIVNVRYRAVGTRRPRTFHGVAEDDTVFGAIAVGDVPDAGASAATDVEADHPLASPPPSPAPWPQLLPIGRLAGRPAFRFTRPLALVGRRRVAHVHLTAPEISNAHAIMLDAGGRVYLRDLASRSGVRLNCLVVRGAYLEDGDHVAFGRFIFQFQAAATPARGPLVEEVIPAAQLEAEGAPHPVPIEGPMTVIGRRPGCDVVLTEASCSTVHAVIFSLSGKRFVRDVGSRTGTFVNGKGVKQEELHMGDVILIGETELRYTAAASPVVTAGPPNGSAEPVGAEPLAGVAPPPPERAAELTPAVVAPEPGALMGLVDAQEGDEGVLADLIGALAEMPEPVSVPEPVPEAAPAEVAEDPATPLAETVVVGLSDEALVAPSFDATTVEAEAAGSTAFDAVVLENEANGDGRAETDGGAVAVASDVPAAALPGGAEASGEYPEQEAPAVANGGREDSKPPAGLDGRTRANGRASRWFSFVRRAEPELAAPPAPGAGDCAADEEMPLWDLSDEISADDGAARIGRVDPPSASQSPDSLPTDEGSPLHGATGPSSASGEAPENGVEGPSDEGSSQDWDWMGVAGGDPDEQGGGEEEHRARGVP